MKYERIERGERVPVDNDKNSSYFMRIPSNQRRPSVSSMQRMSKHQKTHQTVKSSNDLKDSSGVDRKTHRAGKIMKATINKGGSKEINEKLIVIPNFRQQVRDGGGDTKLLSEYKNRKALQRISLKMANQSLHEDEADKDRIGKSNYQKDNKSQRDKGRNDAGGTGKENKVREGEGIYEKGKSLEKQITEKKIRDRTGQNVPKFTKVAENKFQNETFGKSVNSKDRLKQKLAGKETMSLVQVSVTDKRKKNEINDKIQSRRLEPSNKILSGQTAGKPNPRSTGLVIQTQSRPSQVILRGQGQYMKGPHIHVSKIGQTNHLNKRKDVGEVVDHPPRNIRRSSCARPKTTVLSRADAIRPCDYLRALMEDRELCFPKVCAPCPPCHPSTPRIRNLCVDNPNNPCQAHIVECSC